MIHDLLVNTDCGHYLANTVRLANPESLELGKRWSPAKWRNPKGWDNVGLEFYAVPSTFLISARNPAILSIIKRLPPNVGMRGSYIGATSEYTSFV